MDTSKLRSFYYGLSTKARADFALKCDTSDGQIKQIISKHRTCSPVLAVEFDKASDGFIRCDELCPQIDFEYVRTQQLTA